MRFEEYAKFLVQDCLKLKVGQPLLIVGNSLTESFIQLVQKEAKKLESGEVFVIMIDKFQERELYQSASFEEIMAHPFMDRSLYNEIAKLGGAVLSLDSPIPHIFEGIDSSLLGRVRRELEHQISFFREKQEKGEIPWCIASVANEYWAKEILPNEENPLKKLWDVIFDICHIDENPIEYWREYLAILGKRAQILNELDIQTLHYKSKNGTDILIQLPEYYLFQSAQDGEYIVNMPSLEIFTTPSKYDVNGIVYASKPLYYSGVEIKDFWIRFESGKVVDYDAKQHKDLLKEIIETDEGSHYLGEVALVDFDSKINQSGLLFQTTLYDENACCHFALGRGFPECFREGYTKSMEELQLMGMNTSQTHVDFMIGTRDLEITAVLKDGTDMVLMKHGKLIF